MKKFLNKIGNKGFIIGIGYSILLFITLASNSQKKWIALSAVIIAIMLTLIIEIFLEED